MPPPVDDKETTVLVKWHVAAAVIHSVSLVTQFIITLVFSDRLFSVQLTRIYGSNGLAPVGGSFQLAWLLLIFPFVTIVEHIIQAARRETITSRLVHGLHRYPNLVRYATYAISASVMSVSILLLSRASDVTVLFQVVVANVVMQLLGYAEERRRREFGPGLPVALGWVLFLGIWSVKGWYFASGIALCGGAARVPAFVFVAFIGLAVFYAAFGFLMLQYKWGADTDWLSTTLNYEISWIVLSLTSKLFLPWTVLIGALAQPAVSAAGCL